MARVVEPISDEELKKITVANLRKEYSKLADFYRKIINGEIIKCDKCGEWKNSDAFYQSNTTADGIEHYGCKACILDECTDYDKKTKIRTDNKEKTIETFKRLNWYFDEPVYLEQLKTLNEATGEKIRSTAVQQWIVMSRSLPQYRNYTFKDSVLADESEVLELTSNRKPRKEILKIFGGGFTNDDYLYLQDQYDDWKLRTEVDSKSQETYIIQICFKQLEIWKAQKTGKDTDKLIKSLNDLMNGANLQPRQNVGNAATDSLTFGQLIERWEETKPIPKLEESYQDYNNYGKYIRIWFKGCLARALNLDNGYSKEFDEYIEQYTVHKPEYTEESDSEGIYNTLFGNNGE